MAVRDQRGRSSIIPLEEVGSLTATVITYEAAKLLGALRRRNLVAPDQLVEVRDAMKLAAGLSKDQGGEKRWDVFKGLAAAHPGQYAKNLSELTNGKALQPPKEDLNLLLLESSAALEILWLKLRQALEERGEWQRFVDFEIPVQQVFWHRQIKGIGLNRQQWAEARKSVKKEKYSAYRVLAKELGMSPSSLTFNNVLDHLSGTDAAFLSNYDGSAYIEGHFELAQERSEFARTFVAFARARRDEAALIRVGSIESRIYPLFECFGTVTGRIIVSDPALQGLRRLHRGIIAADDGQVLLYCDYSQFEPGIVASISGDTALLDAYNSADLYSELGVYIFGDRLRRREAKRVFLSYLYGMSSSTIASVLAGPHKDSMEISKYKDQIESFFGRFRGLATLREEVLTELQTRGRVGSLLGNFRVRSGSGRLTKKEQQWALSQRIQGTASLIFKEAIREVAAKFGNDSILLPMHDALLMQADASSFDLVKNATVAIMEAAFHKWCPKVKARVVVESFATSSLSLAD